jgi:hypothetical protein
MERKKEEIPIWHKLTLSYREASLLSGIGEARLRTLAERVPKLRVCIDSHSRIKRVELEKYIENARDI